MGDGYLLPDDKSSADPFVTLSCHFAIVVIASVFRPGEAYVSNEGGFWALPHYSLKG